MLITQARATTAILSPPRHLQRVKPLSPHSLDARGQDSRKIFCAPRKNPLPNAPMKSHAQKLLVTTTAAVAVFSVTSPLIGADAKKPAHTIKEVMKEVHKGDDNIGKRVTKGAASKEDITKMVDYYEALPSNEPPRGDKASWAAKTSKLLAAAKAVKSGTPGALDQYKEAANCKACHTEHKPEQKQ
jgi:hypothetical protein